MIKKYVSVIAKFDPDKGIIPLTLLWEDGEEFLIDRVMDVSKLANQKLGGGGLRYTVRIANQLRELWLEGDRWFVEYDDTAR